MPDEIRPGDYVRTAWEPDSPIYQVVRLSDATAYLRDVLPRANRTREAICHVNQLVRVSPRETARALVEAWLASDFFPVD